MPSWHVFVRESGGDVEHDDCALPVDVVAIPEAPELLLACSVPAVEAQLSAVGGEVQRMHLHPNRRCTIRVLLSDYHSYLTPSQCSKMKTIYSQRYGV